MDSMKKGVLILALLGGLAGGCGRDDSLTRDVQELQKQKADLAKEVAALRENNEGLARRLAALEGRKSSSLKLGQAVLTPVVFLGGDGDPETEYQLSTDIEKPTEILLDPPLPRGAKIVAAWYSPYDNIGALTFFHRFRVLTAGGRQVKLVASGAPERTAGRIRLEIHVLYQAQDTGGADGGEETEAEL